MTFLAFAHLLAQTLAALFALAAALHLSAPRPIRNFYRRHNFPRGFYYVAGTAQAFAALFLAVEQTRIWGGVLGAMILAVTVISLLHRGRFLYAVPAILAMLALAPAMASL